MLRLNNSAITSRLGLAAEPVPCVQCDRREPGLAWGDYCHVCKEERRRKAARVGQRYGIAAAVILAIWLIWQTPPALTQRIFAAASVLLVYLIVRRFVSRILEEYLPKELR